MKEGGPVTGVPTATGASSSRCSAAWPLAGLNWVTWSWVRPVQRDPPKDDNPARLVWRY